MKIKTGTGPMMESRPLVLCFPSWPLQCARLRYQHGGAEGYCEKLNLLSWICFVLLIECQDLGYFVAAGSHESLIEVITAVGYLPKVNSRI